MLTCYRKQSIMDWTKTVLRKECINRESETEISHDRYIHTRKLESTFNTTIRETQIVIRKTGSERNQYRTENSLAGISMDNDCEQTPENNLNSDDNYEMMAGCQLDSVNAYREHEELEPNCGIPQTTDQSANIGERLDFSLNESKYSKNYIDEINGVSHSSIKSDEHYVRIIDNSPSMSLKNHITKETSPKFYDRSAKQENCSIENKITENDIKTKSDTLNNDRTNYIKESQMICEKNANGRNQYKKEVVSRDIGMDSCCQQEEENFASSKNFSMANICELDTHDRDRQLRKVEDNFRMSQTTDALQKLNENLEMSVNESEIFKKSTEKCNVSTNSYGHGRKKSFKSHAAFLKKYGTEVKFPEIHKLNNGKKNFKIIDNIAEFPKKVRSSKRVNDGTNVKVLKIALLKPEEKPNIRSKLNFSLGKIDMISKNGNPESEKIEVVKNSHQVEIIQSLKREDITNKFKNCNSYLTHPDERIKTNEDEESKTINQSVTNLISYFESLNTLKKIDVNHLNFIPNEKSLGQENKNESIANENKNIKSNVNLSSSSRPQMLKITYNIGDRKRPLDASPEVFLPNGNKHECQNTLSPTTKFGVCGYCKGKCLQFEKSENRLESDLKNIKEHTFIFPDDALKKTETPTASKRFRCNRLIGKSKKIYNMRKLSELPDSKNGDKSYLSLISNKENENENLFKNNTKQTAVKTCLTEEIVYRPPLQHNKIQNRKIEENHYPLRKNPERDTNMKSFIGILFFVIIFAVIYERVAENYILY